jgi:Bacterial regulatory protein, Fis family
MTDQRTRLWPRRWRLISRCTTARRARGAFAERQCKVIDEVPADFIDALKHYGWPGNVRELQNLIERAVIATTSRTLQMLITDHGVHRPAPPVRTLAEMEREHILATLHATNWVIGGWNGAAARLGLSRTPLISRMQRLGITGGSRATKAATASRLFAAEDVRERCPTAEAVQMDSRSIELAPTSRSGPRSMFVNRSDSMRANDPQPKARAVPAAEGMAGFRDTAVDSNVEKCWRRRKLRTEVAFLQRLYRRKLFLKEIWLGVRDDFRTWLITAA